MKLKVIFFLHSLLIISIINAAKDETIKRQVFLSPVPNFNPATQDSIITIPSPNPVETNAYGSGDTYINYPYNTGSIYFGGSKVVIATPITTVLSGFNGLGIDGNNNMIQFPLTVGGGSGFAPDLVFVSPTPPAIGPAMAQTYTNSGAIALFSTTTGSTPAAGDPGFYLTGAGGVCNIYGTLVAINDPLTVGVSGSSSTITLLGTDGNLTSGSVPLNLQSTDSINILNPNIASTSTINLGKAAETNVIFLGGSTGGASAATGSTNIEIGGVLASPSTTGILVPLLIDSNRKIATFTSTLPGPVETYEIHTTSRGLYLNTDSARDSGAIKIGNDTTAGIFLNANSDGSPDNIAFSLHGNNGNVNVNLDAVNDIGDVAFFNSNAATFTSATYPTSILLFDSPISGSPICTIGTRDGSPVPGPALYAYIVFDSLTGNIDMYTGSTGTARLNGLAIQTVSARKFKKNIEDAKNTEWIYQADVKDFEYINQAHGKGIHTGLIADEIESINPNIVIYDDKEEIYTVKYNSILCALLKEFIKKTAQYDRLAQEHDQLKNDYKNAIQDIQEIKYEMKSYLSAFIDAHKA